MRMAQRRSANDAAKLTTGRAVFLPAHGWRSRNGRIRVVFTAAATALLACGSSGAPTNDGVAPGVDAGARDATTGATDAGGFGSLDQDAGGVVGLAIDPPSAIVTVTALEASTPTSSFTANATYKNGSTAAIHATWTVDRIDIAGIDAGGRLVPTGTAFGRVAVKADAAGLSATAIVEVRLTATVDTVGVSPADQGSLATSTTPDPGILGLAYPYDATVFPRGLTAPELMWNGGAAGDVYLVHLVAPSFDLSIFVKAEAPSRYTIPPRTWDAFTTSARGQKATCELKRLSAGVAYASAKQTWTIADANLRGDIYYWAINRGQIVKIDLATGTNGPAFDPGPSNALGSPTPLNAAAPNTPPWQDNGAGERCVACHSVSKDGSKLAGVFSRQASSGPLGFADVSTGTIQAIGDYAKNVVWDALTPDGKLAVLNASDKTLQLVDTQTGAPVATTLDGVASACDPSFSPDGTKLAVAGRCDPGFGWPVEYRTSDLVIYPFDANARTFGAPQTIVAGNPTADAIAFPSFSPDSNSVFFQRGDYSRAKYGDPAAAQYLHGNDDLFVAPLTAGATPIALDAANGKGVLPADSAHLNYAPTVNPIAEGGYVWVVFTSPRDYGNRMVSPQGLPPRDATYANHKQLWVAAVDATLGTVDPSHPAFWLPGQDPAGANMFGYWTLAPCKPTAADGGALSSCSVGFECCTGYCRDTGAGPVCTDQAPSCSQAGDKCTTTANCCGGTPVLTCLAGVCQEARPR